EQPRRILKGLVDVEYVEMPDADHCCGMGGSFSITHYELSRQIARKKADGIRASGADLVVTACPGCLVQLNDIMLGKGLPQKAIHIARLLL
ncbi:MAG: heterodisulfide reductase-related iron-sulfur binding cluster, partial [Desulfobacterales bacterium]